MSESYTGSNAGPIVVTYTIPTDGDDVSAVSVNVVFQPNADNWQYAKRVFPDLLTGGTWTFTSSLTLSNIFVFNGDVSLLGPSNNVAGNAVLNIGLMVLGSPTVGTLQFNGDTASFIAGTVGVNGFSLIATTTNGFGLAVTGNGTGTGLVVNGGASGFGIITTGHGPGAGLVANAGTGTPYAVVANGAFQTNQAWTGGTADPGFGSIYSNSVPAAVVLVNVAAGTPTTTLNASSFGIASVVAMVYLLSSPSLGGMYVTLARAMASTDYIVVPGFHCIPTGTAAGRYAIQADIVDASHFWLWFSEVGSGSANPLPWNGNGAGHFTIQVYGVQS